MKKKYERSDSENAEKEIGKWLEIGKLLIKIRTKYTCDKRIKMPVLKYFVWKYIFQFLKSRFRRIRKLSLLTLYYLLHRCFCVKYKRWKKLISLGSRVLLSVYQEKTAIPENNWVSAKQTRIRREFFHDHSPPRRQNLPQPETREAAFDYVTWIKR